MNRHHYSLSVHGCRLIFLLRQEPAEEKGYKPAEFHWKLSQVSRGVRGGALHAHGRSQFTELPRKAALGAFET